MAAERPCTIAYLGLPGFPFGMADVQRARLLSRGLVESGIDVEVLLRGGRYRVGEHPDISARGVCQGVRYRYVCGSEIRPASRWQRTVQRWRGALGEMSAMRQLRREGRLDVAFVSPHGFLPLVRYWLLSRWYGFPIVTDYVEMESKIAGRTPAGKLDGWLTDRISIRFQDAIVVISRYLRRHVLISGVTVPLLRLPPPVDTDRFRPGGAAGRDFLYCGSLAYLAVIEFILAAFARAAVDGYRLRLIVSGNEARLRRLRSVIDDLDLTGRVDVESELSDEALVERYQAAFALLIPLRFSEQDSARFPHKLPEYLAVGCPVVTTAWGDPGRDLVDGKTAVVVPEYDDGRFAEALQALAADPCRAAGIGANGRRHAVDNYDYRAAGARLAEFVRKKVLADRQVVV